MGGFEVSVDHYYFFLGSKSMIFHRTAFDALDNQRRAPMVLQVWHVGLANLVVLFVVLSVGIFINKLWVEGSFAVVDLGFGRWCLARFSDKFPFVFNDGGSRLRMRMQCRKSFGFELGAAMCTIYCMRGCTTLKLHCRMLTSSLRSGFRGLCTVHLRPDLFCNGMKIESPLQKTNQLFQWRLNSIQNKSVISMETQSHTKQISYCKSRLHSITT
jgi:hypothetical protein